MTLGSSNVLPGGNRTGNLYVGATASVRLPTFGGTTVINGLNGSGNVYYTNSTAATLSLGDNNANGDWTGSITNSTGTALAFTKVGFGTETLSGADWWRGTTTINAGTLLLDFSAAAPRHEHHLRQQRVDAGWRRIVHERRRRRRLEQ